MKFKVELFGFEVPTGQEVILRTEFFEGPYFGEWLDRVAERGYFLAKDGQKQSVYIPWHLVSKVVVSELE